MIEILKVVLSYTLFPFLAKNGKNIVYVLITILLFLIIIIKFQFIRNPLASVNHFEVFNDATNLLIEQNNFTADKYSSAIDSLPIIKTFNKQINDIDSLLKDCINNKTNNYLLSGLQVISKNASDWIHVFDYANCDKSLLEDFFEKNNKVVSVYRNNNINSLLIGDTKYYNATYKNLIILSTHKTLIESSLNQLVNIKHNLKDKDRLRYMDSNSGNLTYIHLNLNGFSKLLSVVLKQSINLSKILDHEKGWVVFSVENSTAGISINGSLKLTEAYHSLITKNKVENISDIDELITNNTAALLVSNVNVLAKNNINEKQKNVYEKYIEPWIQNECILMLNDPIDAFNSFYLDKLLLVKAKDVNLGTELLNEYSKSINKHNVSQFQNYKIVNLGACDLLKNLSINGIDFLQSIVYTQLEDYFLFANDELVIKKWIENYSISNLLKNNKYHDSVFNQLKLKNSLSGVIETNRIYKYLEFLVKKELKPSLKNSFEVLKDYKPFSFRLYPSRNKLEFSAFANRQELDTKTDQNLTLAWDVSNRKSIISGPHLLKSNDISYVFYQLIDNSIQIVDQSGVAKSVNLKLENKIISTFHEIDYFNNGEKQVVFNTANFIYILNASGDLIKKIPIIDKALSALEVVNKDKAYMFFIVSKNKNVYGFNQNGKPLLNWKSRNIGLNKYTNIQKLDNEKLIFVDETGSIQCYSVEGKKIFSTKLNSKIDTFFVDEKISRLVLMMRDGGLKILNEFGKGFNFSPFKKGSKNHFIYADIIGDYRKDYIRYADGELLIQYYDKSTNGKDKLYSKKIRLSLDFSKFNYVEKSIDGKKYLGIVDEKNAEIHLMDKNGINLTGFPIKGRGDFIVEDIYAESKSCIIYVDKNRLVNCKIN